jgi:hypothetical protein
VGDIDNISVIEVGLENGDFEDPSFGVDLITNGDFATDTDWSKGTGWTISGGVAHCDGTQTGLSSLGQAGVVTIGNLYKVTFELSNNAAGNIRVLVGSPNTEWAWLSGNGPKTVYYFGEGNTTLYFQADADFIGDIDNAVMQQVKLREVGQATILRRTLSMIHRP